MDWEEFKEKVKKLLFLYRRWDEIEYLDEEIIIKTAKNKIVYTKNQYNELLKEINTYEYNDYTLKGADSYEALLWEPMNNNKSFYLIKDLGTLNDVKNQITYEVNVISDIMFYYIIKNMDVAAYTISIKSHEFISYIYTSDSVLSFFKSIIGLPRSIYVCFENQISKLELKSLIDSYLFDIARNYNIILNVTNNEEDVLGRKAITYTSNKITPLRDAPNKIYNQALLEKYRLAMISKDPMMKFIEFYHIIEYFFNIVFFEDSYNKLRNIINKEDFSCNNNNDLLEIIEFVRKKFKGSMRVPEGEALLLTLKKRVDIDELKVRLEFISSHKIENYKLKEVSFSKGNEVDLDSKNEDDIYKNLRDRIYKTRNAIVHNKLNDDNNLIYNPFEHEEELRKEIPLMRAIAEQIIIKTAEEI